MGVCGKSQEEQNPNSVFFARWAGEGGTQVPQPLMPQCPLPAVLEEPGPLRPAETCMLEPRRLRNEKELARRVFKRSATLDSHVAADAGLVDTHEKTIDLGKTALLP